MPPSMLQLMPRLRPLRLMPRLNPLFTHLHYTVVWRNVNHTASRNWDDVEIHGHIVKCP
ncbi:hypothetical protein C2S53_004549 [Perilla frutescens var. hirtella]|uniref:Uncharacterized protein n=1 Tax=Perilla frutescens var. hirtella TaxID=608512 RepID=A0AAD4JID7_PERFH|nr:hypothetical protein C2S53_004549 [Perilla frutescens var. hirtella]